MFKWLQKFKFKNTRKKLENKQKNTLFCVEIRVDEKGLIYYSRTTNPYLEMDPEGYAQVCQTIGAIALKEMREDNRILH